MNGDTERESVGVHARKRAFPIPERSGADLRLIDRQRIPSRETAKDLLWLVAEGTAGTVGEEFFQCLVKYLARAFRADVAFVVEVVPDDRRRGRFLACWEGDRLTEPAEYDLAGTPCAEVRHSNVVSYPHGVAERFPKDEMVVELGLDSYLAVALHDSDGAHLGHLGVLAAEPLYPDEENVAAMRIFAARAAGEIERRRHERALREREASHRALAEEQAALRRVATLVAAAAPEQDVFDTVAREVGSLLGADLASLVRYEGERIQILAGWSRSSARALPVPGSVLALDGATPTMRVLQTGQPARTDDLDAVSGGVGQMLRDLHVRSSVAAPITVGGKLWGAVTAARTREDSLESGAERRLGDFAELVAQALANAQAQEDLAASRLRIVEASDAERRRIERNLHDGAQQRLVSLSLSLSLAAAKVRDDPQAGPLVARASEELALALQELPELARGIHPAVLTNHGLEPALAALAKRAPFPVEVVAAPGERLPESVEETAYYVVAEALTNVAKYAGATKATVSAARDDGRLLVTVADDGAGGADVEGGSGLRGLADRVDALQGTFRVESAAGGGTTVAAEIPLAAAAGAV